MTTLNVSSASSEADVDNAERLRAALDVLVNTGAIATLSHEPRPVLVGELQWIDERRILLFTAHGDSPADAHPLDFDDAIINSRGSVTFLRDNHVVSALHGIDDSDVGDLDDYRIAWQLWQEVAPLRRDFIGRCFAALRTDDGA